MKKVFSVISFILTLVLTMCLLNGCGGSGGSSGGQSVSANNNGIKVGIVLIGDENEGYTFSHIDGLRRAVNDLRLDEKSTIIYKYNISETQAAYDACVDLAEQGCKLIITNSYGHQTFCQQAASEYPEIEFVAMTGDTARNSGLENFHNAFTKIYQARYLGGVAAGLKIQELIDNNMLKDINYDADKNVKIGYVGAFPYAEVVSGYTAFFLGVKSIINNVSMEVQYTNSWGNMTAEYEAAVALINDGCVILGQHADTTGAPSATEEYLSKGFVCYNVGYNVDMINAAPHAALVSPTNYWKTYYQYIIDSVMKGEKFVTNWAEGFETDSVRYTKISDNCAEGTEEKLEEIKQQMIDGKFHVFDNTKFTVGGKKVTQAFATDTDGDFTPDSDEAMFDGYYHESYFQAAPSFGLRIDGIKELN